MIEPPVPKQQLISHSELIVEGRVGTVVLEAVRDPPHATNVYRASLLVESVLQGEPSRGAALDIVFELIPPGEPLVVGFAEPPFLPSERVRAYLRWDAGRGAWRTFHWMGKETLEEGCAELPSEVGMARSFDNTKTPSAQGGGTSTP